jgi:hypothetical protein
MDIKIKVVVRASFPAGTHLTAHRSRSVPPCWPVSGLAETVCVPFPGAQGAQWVVYTG